MNMKSITTTLCVLITTVYIAFMSIIFLTNNLNITTITGTLALYIPTIGMPLTWYWKFIKQNRPLVTIWKGTNEQTINDLMKCDEPYSAIISKKRSKKGDKFIRYNTSIKGVDKGISKMYFIYNGMASFMANATDGQYPVYLNKELVEEGVEFKIYGQVEPTGEKFFIEWTKDITNNSIKFISKRRYIKGLGTLTRIESKWFTPNK